MTQLPARWLRVAHLVLGTGIVQGASILTYVVLARLLTPWQYGSYRQLFLVNQILWAAMFSAIPTALLYFGARAAGEPERAAVIRTHVGLVVLIASVPVILLVSMAGPIAGALNNEALVALLPLFAPYPAAYMLHSLVAPVMVARERTAQLPAYMAGIALLNSVPALLAALLTGDLRTVVITATAASILGGVAAIVIMLTLSRGAGRAEVGIRQICVYAMPLLLAAGITTFGLKVDQIAISRMLGAALFAVYAVGAFEIPIYSLIKSSSTAALMPEMTAAAKLRDWPLVLRIWRDLLQKSGAIILPLSAALFAFSQEFITVLFGARYRDAAPIFAIFALLGPVRVVTFGLILRALGRTWLDFLGAVCFLLIVAVAIYPAIRLGGTAGAAVTVVVATFLVALLLMLMTARVSQGGIRMWQLYPPAYLFGYVGLLAGFELLRFIVASAQLSQLSQLLLAGIAAAALSLLLLRGGHRRLAVAGR